MTTKEKVIRESITRIEKRLKEIDDINNARPISDLIEVRKEAQSLLDAYTTIEQRTSTEFIKKIEKLSNKEGACLKLAKKLTGSYMNDIMNEEIKLRHELRDLNNELYYIEAKQK